MEQRKITKMSKPVCIAVSVWSDLTLMVFERIIHFQLCSSKTIETSKQLINNINVHWVLRLLIRPLGKPLEKPQFITGSPLITAIVVTCIPVYHIIFKYNQQ